MGDMNENRKYLVSVKNRLLYGCSFRESREILEDLNEYALESNEELHKRYGTPQNFIDRLQDEALPDKKKCSLRLAGIIAIVFLFIITNRFVSGTFQELLQSLLLITTYIVLSGDNCLSGIIKITSKERREYIVIQSVMFFIALLAQIFTAYVIPRFTHQHLNDEIKLFSTGEIVQGSSVFGVGVVLLFVVFGLERYWKRQQVWMFGVVIQGLGTILSLCQYNSFVGNLTIKPIPSYFLMPCFICFLFSVIWFGLFLRKREENECSD